MRAQLLELLYHPQIAKEFYLGKTVLSKHRFWDAIGHFENVFKSLQTKWWNEQLSNEEFNIQAADLIYYRQPVKIQVQGCVDPYTGVASPVNVQCEFKDDIVELMIDEAAAILAGDIESGNQFSRGTEGAERNN